jgi:hypothetical protein
MRAEYYPLEGVPSTHTVCWKNRSAFGGGAAADAAGTALGDDAEVLGMGRTKRAYNAEFEVGSFVRIANREALEEFLKTWQYHHKLQPEQVDFHDRLARVGKASVYHGGDELYELEGVPGIWHEQCLIAVKPEPRET